jgi:hypothetical protein
MRWGVRRYQNKDGSLTPAGKKRYDKEMEKVKEEEKRLKNRERTKAKFDKLEEMKKSNAARKAALDGEKTESSDNTSAKATSAKKTSTDKKSIGEMSDDELRSAIVRSQLEKQYKDLNPEKVSWAKKVVADVIATAAKEAGKTLLKDYSLKLGKQLLGLDKNDTAEDPLAKMKKELDLLKTENDYHTQKKVKEDREKRLKEERKAAKEEARRKSSKRVNDFYARAHDLGDAMRPGIQKAKQVTKDWINKTKSRSDEAKLRVEAEINSFYDKRANAKNDKAKRKEAEEWLKNLKVDDVSPEEILLLPAPKDD